MNENFFFKTIDLGSDNPQWGPVAIPLHPRSMEKIAGSAFIPEKIIDFISNIRPREDGRYILLNALGAGEYWGVNKNGDYFPEWSLKGDPPPPKVVDYVRARGLPMPVEWGHQTFERYAYPYRHHNNSDPVHAIGDRVCCAAYNDKMHRVELIVFIQKEKAPDLIARIDSGEKIPWSMGAKLMWDSCSVCGNAAKNRGEYCEHLKDSLGKTLLNGEKVFAYNYFPRFFDISEVVVPADRSAYSLKKVASDNQSLVALGFIPPAASAPIQGSMVKYAGMLDFLSSGGIKEATIEKDIPAQSPSKNLGEAPIDPAVWRIIYKLVTEDKASSPSIPDSRLEEMSDHPLSRLLPALTSLGIILKPHEMASVAPDDAEIPDELDFQHLDPTLLKGLKDLVPSRSMFEPHFSLRIMHLRRGAPVSEKGITILRKEGAASCRHYQGYQELLRSKMNLEKLAEATAHPQVQLLLNPSIVEEKILDLGQAATGHSFSRMVLPFVAGVDLGE